MQAADTLSGARPGARVNLEEGYQVRLTAIHDVIRNFSGVLDLAVMDNPHQDVYAKVKLLFRLNDFRGVEALLRSHLEQVADPQLYHWLGVAAYRLGKGEEAIENFRQSLKLDPNNLEGALSLAACLAHLGKYSAAENVYGHAEKTFARLKTSALLPDQTASFFQNWGQMHEAFDDYTSAIENYKNAMKISSHSPYLRLTLAKAYLKKGFHAKAENELAVAMEQLPSSSSPHFLLGLSYYSQGKSDEARRSLRNALKINHKCRQSQTLLDLLEAD